MWNCKYKLYRQTKTCFLFQYPQTFYYKKNMTFYYKKKYDDMPSLLIFFAVVFLFSRVFIFVFLFSRILFFVFVVFRVFFAGFFIGCIAHTGSILRENTSTFVTTHDACINIFFWRRTGFEPQSSQWSVIFHNH